MEDAANLSVISVHIDLTTRWPSYYVRLCALKCRYLCNTSYVLYSYG